jgi:hypothetical protein
MGKITAGTDNLRKVLSANIKKYRSIEGLSNEIKENIDRQFEAVVTDEDA